MDNQLEQKLRLLAREAYARKVMLSLAFALIAGLTTVVGANWPKAYTTSTTIFVDEENIIAPLMAGRAVRTDMSAQSGNARELLESRSLLEKVLTEGGWITVETPPDHVEQELEAFRARMWITNPAENLIKIIYKDGDPQRAEKTVGYLAELFIEEVRRLKTEESKAAFTFIDNQVAKYEQQLERTQQELRTQRESNPLAQPGTVDQVNQRINQLRGRIDALEQEIRETEITIRTLDKQLSGEARISQVAGPDRADPRLERIAELEDELARLRLAYTESYPDIVRLREEIAERKRQMAREEADGGARDAEGPRVRDNPVYQQLQQERYAAGSELNRLKARRADAETKLAAALVRATEVENLRAEYEKLERDYGINTDIYQDLLRRRENARVSVNLDNEQQALTLRIHEPAYRPHQASGPRMLHFAAGGLAAGAALPLAALFGFLLLDPRVRTPDQIAYGGRIEVLEPIPHLMTGKKLRGQAWRFGFAVLIVLLATTGVAAMLLARHWQLI